MKETRHYKNENLTENLICYFSHERGKETFRTDYLVLRAHADSPQQPPLLFAENAVNLPHRWEVKLIWRPIKVEEASLVIIHVAANHFNTEGRFKAGLSGC